MYKITGRSGGVFREYREETRKAANATARSIFGHGWKSVSIVRESVHSRYVMVETTVAQWERRDGQMVKV